MALSCGWALWRGAADARLAAALVLAASGVTFLVNNRLHHDDVQWAVFWVDGAALAGFAALYAISRRRWLLFLTAFQALAVSEHLAMALDAGMDPRAYVGSLYILFAGILVCLVWGARGQRHEAPD